MQNAVKDWLVRTRTGEILGPFTQSELIEELRKHSFTAEDEIAPSRGHWISAQTLTHRDSEELTHTSTRSHAFLRPRGQTGNAAHAFEEDFTPTPEFSRESTITGEIPIPFPQKLNAPPRALATPARKAMMGALALVMIVSLWSVNRFSRKTNAVATAPSAPNSATYALDGENPFLREIHGMIHSGKNSEALKKLTQYHERGPQKGDNEYLIPYAGLLLTERESIPRARKILEGLIASEEVSPSLKARAHLWLGYLLLSQDEGDMGESHFLEVLQLNPKDAAARFNLGRAYLKQEKFGQALDYLQLAELEVPDLWLVHIYKGRARVSLGNMDEARASFKTAVQIAPDRWISSIYYALFLTGLHEEEEAQNVLKRMITRDPHYETLSPAPFGFFQEKVNYGEYLNAFNHVMEKSPGEEREVGRTYINYLHNGTNGPESKKLEIFAQKGGLIAKVIALKVALDKDAAPDDLKNAVLRLPQNLSPFGYFAFVLRGTAKTRLGITTEAQQDFQKALLLEPKAAVTHFQLASLYQKNHREPEAQNEIRQLLSFHPDYIPAIVFPQNF